MASFNRIFLMGNLTRDPQLSYLPSQTPVVDFGLAVNRKWKNREGEDKEEVCFVDCRAFGRMAENINKYLTKGRPLFVEGRLTLDTWTAKDGTKRSKHRVTVERFQFLPGSGSAGQHPQEASANEAARPNHGDSAVESDRPAEVDDIPF